MARYENQKNVFNFFRDHFKTQDTFTAQDIESVTNWSGQTLGTYMTKQFKPFLVEVNPGHFRISEVFRSFSTWEKFREHVTQVRQITFDNYTNLIYEHVIVYEFFMPLTNETHLRTTLDALFYKDTILTRLTALDREKLRSNFPEETEESNEEYLERVCEWISQTFGGYSITHVGGRFRAQNLSTMPEVAKIQLDGGRYLIDETTAIVRFIFPCGQPFRRNPPLSSKHFEDYESDTNDNREDSEIEANRIRWFFGVLFVQSIIQVVNGEDEIWMMESGMRNRLHIWRVEK